MKAPFDRASSLLASQEGPTTSEYAILLALLAMMAVAAFGQFGDRVSGIYSVIRGTMP